MKSYLSGRFSTDKRALPVRSSFNSSQDHISFKVVPKGEISKPNLLLVFFSLIKPLHLSLSLLPLSVSFYFVGPSLVSLNMVLSSLTVFFLHVGMNLINDYNDHMSGLDIAHQYRGSRAIQKAWLRAIDVRNISYIFFALAIFMGLYILLTGSINLLFFALAGLFSLFVFAKSTTNRPVVGLEEIVAFLLLGPILFHALISTAGVGWSYASLSLSVFTGMNGSIYFHFSKWSSLFDDNKANRKSTALSLGVDFSKLASQISIPLTLVPFSVFIYFSEFQLSHYIILVVYLIFTVKSLYLLSRVESSFSSKLREVKFHYLLHAHLLAALFFISFLLQFIR